MNAAATPSTGIGNLLRAGAARPAAGAALSGPTSGASDGGLSFSDQLDQCSEALASDAPDAPDAADAAEASDQSPPANAPAASSDPAGATSPTPTAPPAPAPPTPVADAPSLAAWVAAWTPPGQAAPSDTPPGRPARPLAAGDVATATAKAMGAAAIGPRGAPWGDRAAGAAVPSPAAGLPTDPNATTPSRPGTAQATPALPAAADRAAALDAASEPLAGANANAITNAITGEATTDRPTDPTGLGGDPLARPPRADADDADDAARPTDPLAAPVSVSLPVPLPSAPVASASGPASPSPSAAATSPQAEATRAARGAPPVGALPAAVSAGSAATAGTSAQAPTAAARLGAAGTAPRAVDASDTAAPSDARQTGTSSRPDGDRPAARFDAALASAQRELAGEGPRGSAAAAGEAPAAFKPTVDALAPTPGTHPPVSGIAAPAVPLSPSAPPVDLSVPTPVMSPEFPQALGVQVSVLAQDGVQHAELHLNPGDMGPISVRIELDGQQAQVNFGVESAATRQVLESSLPELASALREAGLTLTGGGVSEHPQGRRDPDHPGAGPDRDDRGLRATVELPANAADGADVPRGRATRPNGIDLYA